MSEVEHILDRPLWHSLVTRHAGIALGAAGARRFPAEISRLGGVADSSDSSVADLGDLIAAFGTTAVANPTQIECPRGAKQIHHFDVNQMLLNDTSQAAETKDLLRLGERDCDEMLALVDLTHPGPFERRTHLLGEYWGIRSGDALVAMAGERMKVPGFTEISGVATHPVHQGLGHAGRLCRHLMARILSRGETPFLHVETTKPRIEEIYRRLGFSTRATLAVQVFVKD